MEKLLFIFLELMSSAEKTSLATTVRRAVYKQTGIYLFKIVQLNEN